MMIHGMVIEEAFFWIPLIIAAAQAAASASDAKDKQQKDAQQKVADDTNQAASGMAHTTVTGFTGAANDAYNTQAQAIGDILKGLK